MQESSCRRDRVTFFVVLASVFVANLAYNMLTTALPSVVADFEIDAIAGQLLTTGYVYALGGVSAMIAFFTTRYSIRNLFLVAMAFFIASCVIAVCARSYPVLLASRFLQACGNGVLIPLVQLVAVAVYPEEATLEEVYGQEPRVRRFALDIRDFDAVDAMVDAAVEEFGRIDILMNNAGTVCRQSFLECTKEGWLEVIDTNLNGVFYVAQAVARTMVVGVQGHILNVSSNSSRTTISNVTPYPPSKSAVKMLTQTMARELAEYGIHVNAIAPGTSLTRITLGTRNDPERNAAFLAKMPFHRYGEIREMVDVSLFLCSEAASFITGETIYEDGGFNLQ